MDKELKKIQSEMDQPVSAVEILRKALKEMEARKENPDQPELLTGDALRYFNEYKEYLPEFLETENGVDALYILCDAFQTYVESQESEETK